VQPLKIAIGNYGLTKSLKDRSTDFQGIEPAFIEVAPITGAMRRMVRCLEFDICEMAFTTYLCAKDQGKPITAIPVFLTRNFHHWAMFHNVKAGITNPKDLEGRKVAINRGYTVTTGLWARGILEHEYGVDLNSISWMPTDDEHVAEYEAPANVDYSYRGMSPADLLLSGEVDAAVGDVHVNSPDIRPIIANANEAGFAYFRKTGVYPINHGLVVKDSLLQTDPQLAQRLFRSFSAAKKIYLAHLAAGRNTSRADESAMALSRVVGDPFPYGVEANKKAIETMVQFAVEQKIISKSFNAKELFAPNTFHLSD
jgi:4,5-dihydroxyphthalate decarboxylase